MLVLLCNSLYRLIVLIKIFKIVIVAEQINQLNERKSDFVVC